VDATDRKGPIVEPVGEHDLFDVLNVVGLLVTNCAAGLDALDFQKCDAVVLGGVNGMVPGLAEQAVSLVRVSVHQLLANLLGNGLVPLVVVVANQDGELVLRHRVAPERQKRCTEQRPGR